MEKISIGLVSRPHGIDGKLKVQVFTDDMQNLLNITHVYIKRKEYKCTSVQAYSNFLLLKLEGIDTANEAEGFRRDEVFIDRAEAHKRDDNEQYIVDLISLDIVDDMDQVYGKVTDVVNYGAGYIIEAKDSSGTEFSFPYLNSVVVGVDKTKGLMKVDRENFQNVRVE